MDTIIILGSLLGVGYFLNNEKQLRNRPPVRDIVNPDNVPNSYNIYESNMVNIVREHEQGLGNDLYQKSKDAKNTRIIPPLYNLGNPTATTIPKKNAKQLETSTQRGLKSRRRTKPSFPKDVKLENRQDYDPLVVDVDNSESGGFNKILDQSFTHQNMVPFFSGTGTNQNIGSNTQPSILERFTGTGTLLKPGKKEADTFFQPEQNPNVFTSDLPDDDTRTRYHVSELKTDQLPFEQKRVGPGLNEGFTTEGVDGFHPIFRAPQQTVDELRVKTNPKNVYGGRTSAAQPIFNQERARQSILQKNQPERTFEKLSFISATPTGVNIRQALPENYENIKQTFRSHEQELAGRVGNHNIERNIVISEYSDPFKKPEEIYDWGSVTKNVKSVVYDENDLPRTTIKQTTLTSYTGGANQSKGKGYLTTTYLAPTTTKETTQTDYYGIAEGSQQQMSQQQYYNAEINGMKESTLINRKPNTVKEQLFYGKDEVNQALNHNVRYDLQENMAKYKNITSIYSQEPLASKITHQKEQTKCIDNRIDPIFTEQVRNNPFSHPLA